MHRLFHVLLLSVLLLSALLPGASFAQSADIAKVTRTPIGTPIAVTPGQEFYAGMDPVPTPGLQLDRPFKGTMPGTLGIPFSFEIDSDVLVRVYSSPSGWDYFVPPDHKFSARSGMLGSVLRDGDSVGLRLGGGGKVEWFVYNSRYARRFALWTRAVKPGEPVAKPIIVGVVDPGAMVRLMFMGLNASHRAKIRLEKVSGRRTRRDEFSFALDQDGRGVGAIEGAEFTIEATPTRAVITMVKAMTSDLGVIVRSPTLVVPRPAT